MDEAVRARYLRLMELRERWRVDWTYGPEASRGYGGLVVFAEFCSCLPYLLDGMRCV